MKHTFQSRTKLHMFNKNISDALGCRRLFVSGFSSDRFHEQKIKVDVLRGYLALRVKEHDFMLYGAPICSKKPTDVFESYFI